MLPPSQASFSRSGFFSSFFSPSLITQHHSVSRLFLPLFRPPPLPFPASPPPSRFPETIPRAQIVYKYRQPAYWYFTSWQDGFIKKKNRANIVSENIVDAMSRRRRTDPKAHKKEFCAYHLFSLPVSEAPGANQKLDTATRVEYFDQASLRHFLRSGEKHDTSVCQRWIVPKGDRAAVIRAAWSPNVCLIERRVNVHGLYDAHKDMHARAVTFEGREHESQSVPLTGTVITQQIQRVCNAIVDHVAEVGGPSFRERGKVDEEAWKIALCMQTAPF